MSYFCIEQVSNEFDIGVFRLPWKIVEIPHFILIAQRIRFNDVGISRLSWKIVERRQLAVPFICK